jgi:uncharacterized membrane protein YdbT with pleckstrin-like domain
MIGKSQSSGKELWRGRPWILPNAAMRTVLVIVIASLAIIVEGSMGILSVFQFGIPVLYWTLIVFFLVWIVGLSDLLILRATHAYILRNDSLEIKVGLLTSRTSMIVPTGFSDLEVIRSVTGRILNTGDILVKTQSEKDFSKRMVKIRDPLKVADSIRSVMARPIFRVDSNDTDKKI